MPIDTDHQAIRQELDRLLASPGFVRNARMSQFLRFLVERHLEGKDDELKESVIGIEVFGRRPDYDPKQNSIVRTEAAVMMLVGDVNGRANASNVLRTAVNP